VSCRASRESPKRRLSIGCLLPYHTTVQGETFPGLHFPMIGTIAEQVEKLRSVHESGSAPRMQESRCDSGGRAG